MQGVVREERSQDGFILLHWAAFFMLLYLCVWEGGGGGEGGGQFSKGSDVHCGGRWLHSDDPPHAPPLSIDGILRMHPPHLSIFSQCLPWWVLVPRTRI
jgi:hypothetical protein